MPVELYLVRHGQTAWSRTGQHTGRTDLPLLPDGEEQARQLASRLGGLGFAAVWSSDLQRARRTAELAGFGQPAVTPLLREYDYGEYEGVTSADIHRHRPGWELFVDGCPGGETPDQVLARARAFLDGLDGADGRIAVFSHGHFMRAIAVAWVGIEIRAAGALALDTASVSVLQDGSHGHTVDRWNWRPEL